MRVFIVLLLGCGAINFESEMKINVETCAREFGDNCGDFGLNSYLVVVFL